MPALHQTVLGLEVHEGHLVFTGHRILLRQDPQDPRHPGFHLLVREVSVDLPDLTGEGAPRATSVLVTEPNAVGDQLVTKNLPDYVVGRLPKFCQDAAAPVQPQRFLWRGNRVAPPGCRISVGGRSH